MAAGEGPDITVSILKGRFPSFHKNFRSYIYSMYISPGYCNPMFGNVYDISWSMCDTVCYTYQAAMPVTCLVSDLQSLTSGQSLYMLTVFPI